MSESVQDAQGKKQKQKTNSPSPLMQMHACGGVVQEQEQSVNELG